MRPTTGGRWRRRVVPPGRMGHGRSRESARGWAPADAGDGGADLRYAIPNRRNRGDLGLLDAIYDPQVVVHDCGVPEALHGLDALKAYYGQSHEGMPDLRASRWRTRSSRTTGWRCAGRPSERIHGDPARAAADRQGDALLGEVIDPGGPGGSSRSGSTTTPPGCCCNSGSRCCRRGVGRGAEHRARARGGARSPFAADQPGGTRKTTGREAAGGAASLRARARIAGKVWVVAPRENGRVADATIRKQRVEPSGTSRWVSG